MRKIYSLFTLTLVSAISYSQTVKLAPAEDTTKTKELEGVVLTGQYRPQSARSSVYQVRTISKERIQKQGASNLQDVLNNELNIRFSQDPATGGSDITMLGLKGQNVKILLDGMPIVGRQGTTNEININQIDINSVERIEIVEGPMSVVYGADALAGVINIITKKSQAPFSVTARLQEETVGKEYSWEEGVHNQYVGLTWKHKKIDVGANFGHNYFGGWKGDSTDREMAWHWKDQLIANGYIGYTDSKFKIRYRIDGLDEVITNPGNYTEWRSDAGDSIAHDQEYLSRRVMQQLQASYFINGNLSFQAQAAYTAYRRQVFSTVLSQNSGKLSMDVQSTQSVVNVNGFTFRGTALYKISPIVSLQPGIDINLENGKGERLKTGENEVNDYALFITSEITPSDKINIRPGLRFIKNSVYDAPPVIPSINTKFVLNKHMDIRVAYARGFRAPSLRELYLNFFDANHQILGNPDLKAETSHSITGSLTWNKKANAATYSAVFSGFYNEVKNLIDYAISASNPNVFMLTNVSNSKTSGGSIMGNMIYKNWNIALGTSLTGYYNAFSEADKDLPQLQWSAEANGNVGYTFSKLGLDANLFYKFTGKQPSYILRGQNITLSTLKGYQIADITVNKKLFGLLTLSAGVKNLFDVKVVNSSVAVSGSTHTSGTSRSVAYGRSYFAGVVFNWQKDKTHNN